MIGGLAVPTPTQLRMFSVLVMQETQNFEVETEEHLLTTAVANYLDPSKFACPMSRRSAV